LRPDLTYQIKILSEKDLIEGCLNNDYKYQKALFDKYSGVLMTICRRYFQDVSLAEDALQDGFIRIYKNLGQFSFKGSFEGWLKRLVVNVCLRKLQKESKQYDWNELGKSTSIAVAPVAESNVNNEDLLQLVQKLPTGYRTVFNMYALDGYSHREIAQELGVTESTSRSQLVKARNMLKRLLEELYEK